MPQEKKEKKKSTAREVLEAVVIALVLALLIRAFVIQAFIIPTGSMEPTLLIGDYLLVNKFIYGEKIPFTDKYVFKLKTPKFDDVVVFKCPIEPDRDYIKRVIGVAGDEIKIVNKKLYINNELKDSAYAYWSDPRSDVPIRDNYGPVIVPPGHVFVMGDNRDNSSDSRYWGFAPAENIKGKALVIYFSWNGKQPNILNRVRWDRIFNLIH